MAQVINLPQLQQNEGPKEVLSTDTTLESLYAEAIDIHDNSIDYVVNKANSLTNFKYKTSDFNGDWGSVMFIPDIKLSNVDSYTGIYDLTRYSLGQLCSKLGVPVKYIEKCLHEGREPLVAENLNDWLQDYNKDLLIRGYKDSVRGILSTKYSMCDTHEILDIVNSSLGREQYTVKGAYLSPERFHMRLVSTETLPIEGEDLFAGITLDSSDVGRSTVSCNFFIYKQVCTNGLIIAKHKGELFNQRHIGITPDEFKEGFKKSLDIVPDLVADMVHIINNAKSTEDSLIGKLDLSDEEMVNMVIENNLKNNVAESISHKWNLSKESSEQVLHLVVNKYGNSKWGLINSITEVAQKYTLETRIQLEKLAGEYLVS